MPYIRHQIQFVDQKIGSRIGCCGSSWWSLVKCATMRNTAQLLQSIFRTFSNMKLKVDTNNWFSTPQSAFKHFKSCFYVSIVIILFSSSWNQGGQASSRLSPLFIWQGWGLHQKSSTLQNSVRLLFTNPIFSIISTIFNFLRVRIFCHFLLRMRISKFFLLFIFIAQMSYSSIKGLRWSRFVVMMGG